MVMSPFGMVQLQGFGSRLLPSPWLSQDGTVVTWGMPRGGGDSRKVQAQTLGTGENLEPNKTVV